MRSSQMFLNKGVPQSSILGPLLYKIYVNYGNKLFEMNNLKHNVKNDLAQADGKNYMNIENNQQIILFLFWKITNFILIWDIYVIIGMCNHLI